MKNIINSTSKISTSKQDKLISLIEKEQSAIKSYQQNLDSSLRGSKIAPSVSTEIRAFIKAEFSKLSKH